MRWPEHDPAEDSEQRGEQCQRRQQHDHQTDGQRRADAPIETKGGEQEAKQRRDHGCGGEGDRLTNPAHRLDDSLFGGGTLAQLFASTKHKEQSIVRTGAHQQHGQQLLGDR